MSTTVEVALNVDGPDTAAVPGRVEVDGDFLVRLENQGTDAHVHLRLDDDLDTVARLPETNHFVEGGAETAVPVTVRPGTSVTGVLEVVTGYGAERHPVEVAVDTRVEETPSRVEADPSPPPAAGRQRGGDPVGDEDLSVPIGVVGALGVVVAVAVAAASDVGALVVGVVALLAGLGGAAYLLTRS